MKGKLESNIDKYFKRSSDLDKKQVYLPYNIQLFSILNDAVTVTDETSVINYGKPSSEVRDEELQKTVKTCYIGLKDPEMIKEFIRIGPYVTDFIQFTKKLFLFYIKKGEKELKILNKLNLSNSETVNSTKFIFTIRSD